MSQLPTNANGFGVLGREPRSFDTQRINSVIQGQSASFYMPPTANKLAIGVSVNDGASWPTNLVLTVQRSNDFKSWINLDPSVTVTAEAIVAAFTPACAYVRVSNTTPSSAEHDMLVSFYAYTE